MSLILACYILDYGFFLHLFNPIKLAVLYLMQTFLRPLNYHNNQNVAKKNCCVLCIYLFTYLFGHYWLFLVHGGGIQAAGFDVGKGLSRARGHWEKWPWPQWLTLANTLSLTWDTITNSRALFWSNQCFPQNWISVSLDVCDKSVLFAKGSYPELCQYRFIYALC